MRPGVILALALGAAACAAPDDLSIEELELGRGKNGFEPLADGDVVDTVIGPQGTEMIVFRLRASGASASLDALVADVGIAGETTEGAIHATLDLDDALVTDELAILLAPQPGELLTVTAWSGGASVVRELVVTEAD